MVFGVVFQVFGQFPDSARQQRDLDVCAAGVLPVQLKLLDIHRFRILSHFEAPIVNEERPFASAGYFGGLLCSRKYLVTSLRNIIGQHDLDEVLQER